MTKIIPTIFAHNKKEFSERFEKVAPLSKSLQIDFMDGKFVHAKSVSIVAIPPLNKFHKKFEAHLMCVNPQKYLLALKKKGFSKIIFHYEVFNSDGEVSQFIEKVKHLKMKPTLAFNPQTSASKIFPFLSNISGVLIMGVRPGKENQAFISTSYNKVTLIKKQNPECKIQIDGGVNIKVLEKLNRLGVDAVNVGSFLSLSENPKKSLKQLKAVANN